MVKWMKVAGIVGFILLVVSVLLMGYTIYSVYSSLNPPDFDVTISDEGPNVLSQIISVIVIFSLIVMYLLFYFGFVKMGKYTSNNLLKITSWINFVVIILGIILMILAIVVSAYFIDNLLGQGTESLLSPFTGNQVAGFEGEDMFEFSGPSGGVLAILIIILLVIFAYFVNQILFNVALIKTGNQVRFSKAAGIVGIILHAIAVLIFLVVLYFIFNPAAFFALLVLILLEGGEGMLILFIGIYIVVLLLGWTALLLMSLALLDASKKFENGLPPRFPTPKIGKLPSSNKF